MNVDELHSLFVSAAETDRRLPAAIRKQKMAAWPDVINDWHGYGWTQLGETVLRPTSKQIDDYDKALGLVVQAVRPLNAVVRRGDAWQGYCVWGMTEGWSSATIWMRLFGCITMCHADT